MKHSLLFVIPLVLLAVSPARAQQTSEAAPPESSAAEPSQTTMTPLQAAELKADILMARKEFVDAIRAYDEILKQAPQNAEVLNKVGVAYQQLIALREAEHYYKKAMHADKHFVSAINNAGTVEYERKHYGKAIGYYKKALELKQDQATIYSNLAYAYVEDKKYVEALDAFRNAIAIDPTIFDRKGGNGTVVQQRTTTDPGLFAFLVAKSYALVGDAEHSAHYLKIARDDGYREFLSAEHDPAFAKVIKDPRVRDVFTVTPSYATDHQKPVTN
ncbi:MAG TPA: tetratricopeptide repeat protein [Candidatus Limnocylindrales bacterium]|nr:tetratricopeptide repeat protein [Candidatus Limnocylindrales bacterium]